EDDMSVAEIMTSESQERMLLILSPKGPEPVLAALRKYDVPYSVVGSVTDDGNLTVRWDGRIVASLPAKFVVKAPLIPWPSRRPSPPRKSAAKSPARNIGRTIVS